MRAGINRHLTNPPHNRIVNLIQDKEFTIAHKALMGRMKKNRAEGRDKTRHKKAISNGDVDRMYSTKVLSNDAPEALLYKVFFEVGLHFGRRGREGWRNLRKDSFVFKRDDSNPDLKYATLTHYETTKKNHGIENELEKDQRMYAIIGDNKCPVQSLEMYLSKLSPKEDAFLQIPRKNISPNDDIWYYGVLGKNTIANMMKQISQKAGLSSQYTNHCIRATTSTVLAHANVDHNDIISITGHKDPKSLLPYIKSCSNEKRREVSSILNSYGKDQNAKNDSESEPQASVAVQISGSKTIEQNLLCENWKQMGMKMFDSNNISGGTFNINFNIKN